MGGEFAIASTLGTGSTFTLMLSNVKVSDSVPVPLEEKSNIPNSVRTAVSKQETVVVNKKPAEAPSAPLKRILTVDNQKMNLIVLKKMLKKLGSFDIVTDKDGKEALDILSASSYFSIIFSFQRFHELFRNMIKIC